MADLTISAARTNGQQQLTNGDDQEISQTRRSWYETLAALGTPVESTNFFKDVEECEYAMNIALYQLHRNLKKQRPHVNREDGERLLQEIQALFTTYQNWWVKVDAIFERSGSVAPIKAKQKALEPFQTMRALCSYKTNDLTIKDGEELVFLQETTGDRLKVRNARGEEGFVPTLCCLIPSPDINPVNAATRLRLQLLASWTTSLKRFEKHVIRYFLMVFEDWIKEKNGLATSRANQMRKDLQRLFDLIVKTPRQKTQQRPEYNRLVEYIKTMRLILRNGQVDATDKAPTSNNKATLHMLLELVSTYQLFGESWEQFKAVTEKSQKQGLKIIEDWEQMKEARPGNAFRYWETKITLETVETVEEVTYIPTTPKEVHHADESSADLDVETVEEHVESEQMAEAEVTEVEENVTQIKQEERKRFIIRAVIDPRDHSEISIQQAIMLGIVNQNNGTYVNPDTGDAIPIPEAMTTGQIQVQYVQTSRTKEETKSFGLITIRTTVAAKPYTIVEVIDTNSGLRLTVNEATHQGILDESAGTYMNNKTGREMLIVDAIESGLVITDDCDTESETSSICSESDMVTKTYAINGVVDQRLKKKVPFQEAVRKGLIEKDTGCYVNNVTGERLHPTAAIKFGFLKAKLVDDPSSLDIDPENRVWIERVDYLKKKVLRPAGVISAFRRAAQNRL